MATEVHYKDSFDFMRNVNEDSNSNSWHLFYGDNTFTNSHYYNNNFNPITVTDPYLGHEKDELKQKMLQHEAIFKTQVYELHRLYRRQRDMMEEIKRKEFNKYHPIDTSSSSSFMPSQKRYENSQNWQISRPSIFGVEISNSPVSCSKGNNDSKDCEIIDCRPSKVRKKLFDLQLPAYEYIDPEEGEQVVDNQTSEISSRFLPKNGVKTFLDSGYRNSPSGQHRSNGLTDLNEPVYIQDYSRFNQTSSILMNPFISTSEMGNSWSPKPNDNLNRKLQKYPSFLSSNRGDKCDRNDCYGNQFFHGSSSRSKEVSARLPSTGFDYRNKIDNGSKRMFIDLTESTKGMDLNTIQISDNEDDLRKCDKKVLPWLKSKPDISKKVDVSKEKENKKLIGFPIFGGICKNDDSSSMENKGRGIDINVAWDDVADDKRIDVEENENKNFKNNFDLNSCVTEDDEMLVTESVKSSTKKMRMEIDLEAPFSEIEEEEPIQCGEEHEKTMELEKIVAEAIVEMSHVGPTENGGDSTLLWFVELAEKHTVSVSCEMDEYEMLTLQIEESREEDYMPTHLAPDVQEPDEVGLGPGPALTSRPRRGQARRGRPRRDFQRDILPGMESLSRHEISEDLQIFGGLMKATGHSWNFGTMKRNGKRVGARGRRKGKVVEIIPVSTAPPPPPVVVGLEEGSFTGWGKTTRRPRRQRSGVSNTVVVQSS